MGKKLYGSVSNAATKVEKFYGSVSNRTKEASKIYGSVQMPDVTGQIRAGGAGNVTAFDADTFRKKMVSDKPDMWERAADFDYLKIDKGFIGTSYTVKVHSDAYGEETLLPLSGASILASYGITAASSPVSGSDYIDLTPTTGNFTKLAYKQYKRLSYPEPTYGRVTYYSSYTIADWTIDQSTGLTITSYDAGKTYTYLSQNSWILSSGKTNIWFWMDNGTLKASAERSNGNWDSDLNGQMILTNCGMTINLTAQSGNLVLGGYVNESVDKSSALVTVDLLNNTEFQSLGKSSNSSAVYTIGGQQVARSAVRDFRFGTVPTVTPGYFLAYATSLLTVTSPKNITLNEFGNYPFYNCSNLYKFEVDTSKVFRFGSSAFYNCSKLRSPIDTSATTSFGMYFLYNCTSFNHPLNLSKAGYIGQSFMRGCTLFNQPVNLSNAKTVETNCLYGCTALNSYVTFPNIATIPTYFMYGCTAFNRTFTISSTTTSIGTYFLRGCTAFNQTFNIPSSVTSIGSNFLAACSSFNKNITLPSTITSIGTYFMNNCNKMTSTITCNCPATVASSSNYTLATTSTGQPMYTTGIKLSGTYKNEWHTAFPDRSSSPYRKTVVV